MCILQWRFAFNYNVIYDIINDDVSRVLDLVNFVALIVGHSIVAMELLWRNHSEKSSNNCNIFVIFYEFILDIK